MHRAIVRKIVVVEGIRHRKRGAVYGNHNRRKLGVTDKSLGDFHP
jgi:hypothetical protein